MTKKLVSTDRLIEELNKAYAQDSQYDENNLFKSSPPASIGRGTYGYTTVGIWTPGHDRARHKVNAEFELDVEGGQ